MIKSIRIQLLPNNKQRTKLFQFAGASRFAYNWALDKQIEKSKIPIGVKYTNPRITFDGENWWLSIGIRVSRKLNPMRGLKFIRKQPSHPYTGGIGIDLGIKDLAIISDSTIVKNINKSHTIRKLKKKRRRLQRQVSRKYQMNKKGESYYKTSNLIKSEKRLLRINHRLTNIRTNHVHQATAAVIERKPSFICLEDLNVQGMMKNRHLSEKVQEQNLYEFRRQIEYKAHWAKIAVVIADRLYPSSKTCIECGYIKKDLKLSARTYICPQCGNVIDRDFQAALNLRRYGEAELSKSA